MDKHFWIVIRRGLLAGVIGGLVYGAALAYQGRLPFLATLLGGSSVISGISIHLIMSALNGALFSLLVQRQIGQRGEILFWGMVFGVAIWIIGPLTIVPVLTGSLVAWDISVIQKAFPDLIGHIWYGATTAIALSLLRQPRHRTSNDLRKILSSSLWGAGAGLLAIWLMHLLFGSHFQLDFLAVSAAGPNSGASLLSLILTGATGGLFYSFLYRHAVASSGGNLVRGMLYGFFMWIAGPLTLMPLLAGYGIHWDVELARIAFNGLPGFLLFGTLLALLYQRASALFRLLFGNTPHELREGSGTIGVRGLLRGTVAGFTGGLLFTFFMLKMGALPMIARLAGGSSSTYGLFVHLLIAIIIGISYSLMFRSQSVDLSSAMGWGLSYGFFWWVLGGITLMPLLLGGVPQWGAAQAARAFPSLIGHLAYGSALGIGAFFIERRQNPWWLNKDALLEARTKRELDQLQSSAPALWTLTAILAVLVPALLAV